MKWTTKKPKEPGWFWVDWRAERKVEEIILGRGGKLLLIENDDGDVMPVEDMHPEIRFAGPIPPPEEP